MKMPFGKYKDREIHETPRHYLRWALENMSLDVELKRAMEYGLEKREYSSQRIEYETYEA